MPSNRRRTSFVGRFSILWEWLKRFVAMVRAQAGPFIRRHPRECGVLGAMALVLAVPFVLRPSDGTAPSHFDRRLVIMTPHHELIRREFGRAFAKQWKQKTGQTIYIDWRVQGTSELAKMIESDFKQTFQRYWQHDLNRKWDPQTMSAFLSAKTDPSEPARAEFLKSNVSIGVDVLFGGGPYDFQAQADSGALVAADGRTGAGLQRIREKHPQWFGDNAIPDAVSGELFHDKSMRWCGTCLSSFGIVFNRDVLRRLGIDKEPTQWTDLADPRLMGQIALADPGKSGSVTKAFEMLIQQQMHEAVSDKKAHPGNLRKPEDVEAAGVREGWLRGLALIQKISANARYFTDQSPKIPLEVARGDAAVGMCIDFYGRSAEENVRRPDGSSRIGFVAPVGGTAVSVDPIGMMRGAPDPELAEAFIEFVLSDAGQKLWNFRAGEPGGPETVALRRLPIRKDLYTLDNMLLMTDAHEDVFKKAEAFVYHPEWTSSMFNVIRFLIRVMCVDMHPELRSTWRSMAANGVPFEAMRQIPNTLSTTSTTYQPTGSASLSSSMESRAVEIFHGLQSVDYDNSSRELSKILRSPDKVPEVREARRLTESFRRQYEKAAHLR